MNVNLKKYKEQKLLWPDSGCQILANYNEDSIVVYQAFSPSIAEYAVRLQRFGGPDYKLTRMTWIKTSFLWMMFRSGWATKKDQERILAIYVSLEGFEEILRRACLAKRQTENNIDGKLVTVRLQWDPDHNPYGEKEQRRAVQLGLRGDTLNLFLQKWILQIEDITNFVKAQHEHVLAGKLDELEMPEEKVYIVKDKTIVEIIGLDK